MLDALSQPADGTGSLWTILMVWFLVAILAILFQNRPGTQSRAGKGNNSDASGGRDDDTTIF